VIVVCNCNDNCYYGRSHERSGSLRYEPAAVLRSGAKLRVSRTYRERLHTRLGARPEPNGENATS